MEPEMESQPSLGESPREGAVPIATDGGNNGEDHFHSAATDSTELVLSRSRAQQHLTSSVYDEEPCISVPNKFERDKEIQALNEEFQERLGKILEDRRRREELELLGADDSEQPAEQPTVQPSEQPAEKVAEQSTELPQWAVSRDDRLPLQSADDEPPEIMIVPLVYWVWQVIMSLILLCSMVINMVRHNSEPAGPARGPGLWSHYNLFVYAYINSGMLPTAVQALSYLAVNMPAGLHGSYSSLQYDDVRLLEAGSGERRKQAGLMEANRRLMMLLAPLLLPLMVAVPTHVVPFCICYPWVVALTAFVTFGLIWLTRRLAVEVRVSVQQLSDATVLLVQLIACLFFRFCVPTMDHVFAGEWRHGGYFNQLFSRVFNSEFKHVDCTWFSFSHGVDAVLRWT